MSIAAVRTTVFARDACESRIGAMLFSILCNVDRVVDFLLNSSTKGAFPKYFRTQPSGRLITRDRDAPQAGALV